MKVKINKTHLFFVFFALLLLSCNKSETEQIFEDSSAVRKEKREQELRNLLLSSEQGWKVTYFTDNTQLGGFTFLFRFIDDTQIEMVTDFNNGYTKMQSEYDILYSSTTKLSFSTKNYIHDLSDSADSPDSGLTGRGYKGDFEFLYYGAEGDDIIFRTNRDFIELRFSKATEDDWDNFEKNQDLINFINNSSRHLAYKKGDIAYNFFYNSDRRFAINIEENNDLNFGVGFTSTGIVISPAILIDGKQYSEFTLNKTTNKFVLPNQDFDIEIINTPIDLSVIWFTQIDSLLNSKSFAELFKQIEQSQMEIYPESPLSDIINFGDDNIELSFFGTFFTAQHGIFYRGVIAEPTFLDIRKAIPRFGWNNYTHFNPLVDAIANNSPYDVVEINSSEPMRYRLNSQKDPNFWFIIQRN
ncbi:MAG: DUF4302 domain-containing protein [Tenacibaculum sp.]